MGNDDSMDLNDLRVMASGAYKVQLAGRHVLGHTVDVHASVDPATGEVRFYVNPDELDKLK